MLESTVGAVRTSAATRPPPCEERSPPPTPKHERERAPLAFAQAIALKQGRYAQKGKDSPQVPTHAGAALSLFWTPNKNKARARATTRERKRKPSLFFFSFSKKKETRELKCRRPARHLRRLHCAQVSRSLEQSRALEPRRIECFDSYRFEPYVVLRADAPQRATRDATDARPRAAERGGVTPRCGLFGRVPRLPTAHVSYRALFLQLL